MKNGLPRAKSRGFTLIELLVVIFIIGLLASIVTVSVTTARGKARDARRIADIKALKNAIEMYANANQKYPPVTGFTTDGWAINISQLDTLLNPVGSTTKLLSPIPHDPTVKRKDNADPTKGDRDYLYVSQAKFGYGLLVTFDDGKYCLTGNNLNKGVWWGTVDICSF